MKQSFTQEDLGMDRLEVMYALTERSNGAFKPYMVEIGSSGALIVDDKQLSPVKLVHLPDGDWLLQFSPTMWFERLSTVEVLYFISKMVMVF